MYASSIRKQWFLFWAEDFGQNRVFCVSYLHPNPPPPNGFLSTALCNETNIWGSFSPRTDKKAKRRCLKKRPLFQFSSHSIMNNNLFINQFSVAKNALAIRLNIVSRCSVSDRCSIISPNFRVSKYWSDKFWEIIQRCNLSWIDSNFNIF